MTRSERFSRGIKSIDAEVHKYWRGEYERCPWLGDKGRTAERMYEGLDDPDPWLSSRNKREIYLAIAAYYLTLGGYARLVEVLMLIANNSSDKELSIIRLCNRHKCSYQAAIRLYNRHLAELRRIFLFTKRVRAPPPPRALAA